MEMQEIIVSIIAVCCFAWVARRIWLYVNRVQQNENPCSGCTSHCALRSSTHGHVCEEKKNEEKMKKSTPNSWKFKK